MTTEAKETSAAPEKEGKETTPLLARFRAWTRSPSCRCFLLTVGAAVLLFLIFFFVCTPKKYDLKEGAEAHETIVATRDVVDEVRTQERRETAAAKVEVQYKYRNVTQEVMSSLESAFDELRAIQQYGESLRLSGESRGDLFSVDQIEYAAFNLVDQVPIDGEGIRVLMRTSTSDFDKMVDNVSLALSTKLNMDRDNVKILQEQETVFIDGMLKDFGTYYPEIKADLRNIILPIVLKECIQPNWLINQEDTEAARNEAMESVNPLVIHQGEPVITEGDTITYAQIQLLQSLNLLKDGTYDYSSYSGSALAVILAIVILTMCLKMLRPDILRDVRQYSVVLLILLLCMALAALAHFLPSLFIIPVALGSILGTILIGYRIGISVTCTLTLLYAFLIAGNSKSGFDGVALITLMSLAQGIVCMWFMKGRPQRIRVLIAGLLSAVTGVLLLLAVKWLTSAESVRLVEYSAWTIGGGFLSGLLAVAFQPAFETIFRLATPSRLLELTNPNQPLMKRLMIEAPGTYHHSIIVANLAEAASDSIGANPYLARAGAYYHDIGKLKRPGYFKENQNGDNPHERTDPYVSAAIVTSHTMDGVLLAQKERMPQEVMDIILQHHGVTPVMYFYHKALQLSNGSHVDINEFRYAGPKPQTKEAAVVMLADTIEAAVRSMKTPTPKAIDQFIEQLVRGKLEDGQLSDSPLSLRDIDKICEAFSGILKGVYHERIEYPQVRHYAGQPIPETAPAPAEPAPAAPAPETQAPAEAPAAPVDAAPAAPPAAETPASAGEKEN
ncbi:MAG: HDIG domain-containing protein [Clostridiales bacterium]|nr:HDIG domain-containing protein [Clostridiales bacterium]